MGDTTNIKPVGDLPAVRQLKFKNDDKEVAMDSKYISNTRLLSIFDVDDTKGYISTKELQALSVLQEEYFVELYDSQGRKIRDVEDIDAGNYLVRDFETKKVIDKETNQYVDRSLRVRAGIYNVDTGNEDHSDFTFNEYGEETGLVASKNNTPVENIKIEYAEDGVTPVKITTQTFEYDSEGTLKNTKEEITKVIYDEQGNVIGLEYEYPNANKK